MLMLALNPFMFSLPRSKHAEAATIREASLRIAVP
jgi:hypothetical protein